MYEWDVVPRRRTVRKRCVPLIKRGKSIFSDMFANLVRRAKAN